MAHVTTRSLSWDELVQKAWGKDYTAPEIGYEFTRRKFNDRGRPHESDGISAPSVGGSDYADDYADGYA
jgi:hypothetical protein